MLIDYGHDDKVKLGMWRRQLLKVVAEHNQERRKTTKDDLLDTRISAVANTFTYNQLQKLGAAEVEKGGCLYSKLLGLNGRKPDAAQASLASLPM